MRTYTILIWVLLIAGLGGSALWASTHSAWVQARMFGEMPPAPAQEKEPNPDPRILWQYDRDATIRLQDLCTRDRYFVDYRINSFFPDIRNEVFVDGDHVSRRRPRESPLQPVTPFDTLPRELTQDELFAIWSAVEPMHPLDPPPEAKPTKHVEVDSHFVLIVSYAVCEGGSLWTAGGNNSEPDTPAMRASAVFQRYGVSRNRL